MMHNILLNFMFLGVFWIQLFWILKNIFHAAWPTWDYVWSFSTNFFFHCRFIFCRAVLFYFHPKEHEQHVPTCLPNLPESVSPTAEAIKTPILLLAENLVVSNRFHFRDSRHKKWSTAMTIDQAFCRYLLGKYSPAICWLFRIYTANGDWLGINKLLQRLGDLSGDTKSFACCFISIVRLYKFV